jgi:hypothetical protein
VAGDRRSGGAVKQWGHHFSRERSRREAGGSRVGEARDGKTDRG